MGRDRVTGWSIVVVGALVSVLAGHRAFTLGAFVDEMGGDGSVGIPTMALFAIGLLMTAARMVMTLTSPTRVRAGQTPM